MRISSGQRGYNSIAPGTMRFDLLAGSQPIPGVSLMAVVAPCAVRICLHAKLHLKRDSRVGSHTSSTNKSKQ